MIKHPSGDLAILSMFWTLIGGLTSVYALFQNEFGLLILSIALSASCVLVWLGIRSARWFAVVILVILFWGFREWSLLPDNDNLPVRLVVLGAVIYSVFRFSRGDESDLTETDQEESQSMIDWTCVPERFHYLQNPVLESRGGDLRVSLYDEQQGRHVRPAETVTEVELPELIRVYHEICRREDNIAILEWIDGAQEAGDKECTAAWELGGLVFLLHELGEMKKQPFCNRMILAEKPQPPLDWSTLPSDVAYLREAVEKYSGLSTEMGIQQWLEEASEQDLDDLRELAERMDRDDETIGEWSSKHRKTREEFHVWWLGMIFDHAGI